MRGATPVIADVDRDSGNLTAATVEPLITPRTKAIIPVHLGGWPVDMPPLMALARAHGITVIEDCAQAHGATIDGRPVGAFGDAAAFSFCQDKILTTGGEGGLLALDDEAAWRRAWAFKDHGKSYEAVYEREHPSGFRWVHESFGTNWRMLEVQAAIGRASSPSCRAGARGGAPTRSASRRRSASCRRCACRASRTTCSTPTTGSTPTCGPRRSPPVGTGSASSTR
jgi:dTDP-4-amino-4,6-dideoxygalactose transaminase